MAKIVSGLLLLSSIPFQAKRGKFVWLQFDWRLLTLVQINVFGNGLLDLLVTSSQLSKNYIFASSCKT